MSSGVSTGGFAPVVVFAGHGKLAPCLLLLWPDSPPPDSLRAPILVPRGQAAYLGSPCVE